MSLAKLCSWITVSGESVRCLEVGVNGLGYVCIPSPLGYVGDTGEVNPRGGVFLPTLRGTVGLMRSSCVSRSCGMPATEPVSAPPTPRLRGTVSDFGAFASDVSGVGDSVFRAICSGLDPGWSFSGGAICERPVARLQGSCLVVSTGGERELIRPTRSEKLTFFLLGPETDT